MNNHHDSQNSAATRKGASIKSITDLAHEHYPLYSIVNVQVPTGWVDRDECVVIWQRLIEIRDSLLSSYPADLGAQRIVVIDKRARTATRYMEYADASAKQKAEVVTLIEALVTIGQCSGVLEASGLAKRPVHVLVAEEGWVSGVELAQIFGDLASAS